MTHLIPANILIIKPGAIGDLLQITPVIRALHGEYLGATSQVYSVFQ